jgi:riboflavin kinase/FMN adenylyltransferase
MPAPAVARPSRLSPHLIDDVPPGLQGGIVAIGNFDGVHRGHAELLRIAVAAARARGIRAVVLTFEPHPRTLFKPDTPVFRLTPLAEKTCLVAALGIDGVVVIPFDRSFSTIPAEAFIATFLVERLAIVGAVVGDDFHFGKGRGGSARSLKVAGDALGFPVEIVARVAEASAAPITSSEIREALAGGNIARANALLGHRWFVTGEVIAGDRRGRELGFPTANMRLAPDCRLRQGIYAVRFGRADGTVFAGVASYGRRPTFDNGPPLLETFAFDFSGDLYGETVTVTFLDWIRPEERFETVAALIGAMNRDAETARKVNAAAGPGNAIDRAISGPA